MITWELNGKKQAEYKKMSTWENLTEKVSKII